MMRIMAMLLAVFICVGCTPTDDGIPQVINKCLSGMGCRSCERSDTTGVRAPIPHTISR